MPQAFGHQPVLRGDHVVVIVARKLRAHAVRRLGRFPWPMASGRMMKYLVASSGWPGPNSSPAKAGVSMLAPEPVGAVQDQHGLAGGLADGPVVQAQLRHRLAGVEAEVARDPVAFLGRGIVLCRGRKRDQRHNHTCQGVKQNAPDFHATPPSTYRVLIRGT